MKRLVIFVIFCVSLTGCQSETRPTESNPPPPKTEIKKTKDGEQLTITTTPD